MRRPAKGWPGGRGRGRLLALTGAALLSSGAAWGAEVGAAPRAPRPSVRDSPGWYPAVDPESSSVALGRRPNAPRASLPLRGGARSLDDLGRAVCRAIHHGQRDSLLALCVSEDEFRAILWREFPQSRPAAGIEWEDAWGVLRARLHAGCSQAISEFGGRTWEFVRFERAGAGAAVPAYRNFRLHPKLVMVVRDDTGAIQRWGWLRAAVERGHAFKIYSTDD